MKKPIYDYYLGILRNLQESDCRWTSNPNRAISALPLDNSGFSIVLRNLSDPVVRILSEVPDGTFDGDTFDFAVGRMMEELYGYSGIYEFNRNAVYFIVLLYMHYFGAEVEQRDIDALSDEVIDNIIMEDMTEKISDPVMQALLRYRNRLLNLSRGNNQLVNFVDRKSSTIRITYPAVQNVAKSLLRGQVLTLSGWDKAEVQIIRRCERCGKYLFSPYNEEDKNKDEHCPNCSNGADYGTDRRVKPCRTLPEKPTVITDGMLRCGECGRFMPYDRIPVRAGKLVKITCPHCEKGPITGYPIIVPMKTALKKRLDKGLLIADKSEALEAAKAVAAKERNLNRNFGLHSLYMAFGFLHWQDDAKQNYRTPILLCRVSLTQEKSDGSFRIRMDGDEADAVTSNTTLAYILRNAFKGLHFDLPQYTASEGIDKYLFRLRERLIKLRPDWKVELSAALGMFNHQKTLLEYELVNNIDAYHEHPFLNRLCGGDAKLVANEPLTGKGVSILDADTSQQRVLDEALTGNSFVLQGPPGTGKSQTICNIISEFISRGKTVLFVTQKSTARAIIYNHLQAVGIEGGAVSDFCLNFDDLLGSGNNITKKAFAECVNGIYSKSLPVPERPRKDISALEDKFLLWEMQMYGADGYRVQFQGKDCALAEIFNESFPYADYPLEDLICASDGDLLQADTGKLQSLAAEYYRKLPQGVQNYKTHPLYGYTESDASAPSIADIDSAVSLMQEASRIYEGLNVFQPRTIAKAQAHTVFGLEEAVGLLRSLCNMPNLVPFWFQSEKNWGKFEKLFKALRKKCEEVQADLRAVQQSGVIRSVAEKLPIMDYYTQVKNANWWTATFSSPYKKILKEISAAFTAHPKLNREKANIYVEYLRNAYRVWTEESKYYGELRSNEAKFGSYKTGVSVDWEGLWKSFVMWKGYVHSGCLPFSEEALIAFATKKNVKEELREKTDALQRILPELRAVLERLSGKFDASVFTVGADKDFRKMTNLFRRVRENIALLPGWIPFAEYLQRAWQNEFMRHITESLATLQYTAENVGGVLMHDYYRKVLNELLCEPRFAEIAAFDRSAFERALRDYRKGDELRIRNAGADLYEALQTAKDGAVREYKAHNPKKETKIFSERAKQSIRELIRDNQEMLHRLKPCFMMSPLNVAQYIHPDVRFDLVIFDESSQIFTEDALASIYRGRQVIIAGDIKQLPPVNFFRSRGGTEEDEASGAAGVGYSVLGAAAGMLGGMSLMWHYRSHDERLITFSNRAFYGGKLITFPPAFRNEDEGVFVDYVPYEREGCYESGKKAHINKNEAQRLLDRMTEEILRYPDYSIGIVAFSATQADYIEKLWSERCKAGLQREVADWCERHKDEPLIICNLDSIQGDERDIILVATCYGVDREGKFNILTLGPLMSEGGGNRLNVAITRARRRMVVVTSLKGAQVAEIIEKSKGTHLEGAKLLRDFLYYAEGNPLGTAEESEREHKLCNLTKSVCKVLDAHGIAYDTAVGDSDCKVEIAVKDAGGTRYKVAIDTDGDESLLVPAREFARLRDARLSAQGWKTYRIYAASWFYRRREEEAALLEFLRSA